MHRIFHMPGFGENYTLDHYADGYENCTKLARDDPSKAARNSATLRLFALDVYAYDVAVPGIGCTGDEDLVFSSASESPAIATPPPASATPPAGATPEPASTVSADPTPAPAPSSTISAPQVSSKTRPAFSVWFRADSHSQNCHTHSNGDIHCE